MKKILFLFSLSIILFSCKSELNLSGEWNAYGYNCEDQMNIEELILITHKNNSVVATKIIGDNCIKSGEITWQGEINGREIIGEIIGLNPETLEKNVFPLTINILNENELIFKPIPEVLLKFERK